MGAEQQSQDPDVYIVPLDASDKTEKGKDVLSKAVKAFLELFERKPKIVFKPALKNIPVVAVTADLPSSLLDFQKSINFSVRCSKPVMILGPHSKGRATLLSYERLGLDLFDLPWGSKTKWANYLPFDNLLKLFDETKGFLITYSSTVDINLVHNDLQWARCHELYRAMKNAMGHGNRDWLQSRELDEVSERLKGEVIERYQIEYFPCKGRCGLIENLRDLLDNQTVRDEQSRLRRVQKIADLSCGIYLLSPPFL